MKHLSSFADLVKATVTFTFDVTSAVTWYGTHAVRNGATGSRQLVRDFYSLQNKQVFRPDLGPNIVDITLKYVGTFSCFCTYQTEYTNPV